MKKILVCIGAVALSTAASAADPVSQKTAKSLSITAKETVQDVQLFEDGTNLEHVCYYKMTLSKGKQYTLWLESESPNRASIAIESADAEFSSDWNKTEPGAFFETATYGEQVRWVFTGDGWSLDDDSWSGGGVGDDSWGSDWSWGDDDWDWGSSSTPSSWSYYLVVRGKPGATAKLHAVASLAIPEGVQQNPTVLVPSTARQESKQLTFVDNRYYLSMKVSAGQRYYVATTGGTDVHDLQLIDLPADRSASYDEWASPNNDARVFIPESDATCLFNILTENGAALPSEGIRPTVIFRKDAVRTIAEHVKTTLRIGETAVCKPGYKNRPDTGAYDPIVDEALYSFEAEKGASYLIETEGSADNIEMVLYDSAGKVLKSNTSLGRDSMDVRCALEAVSKKATYYVGVCANLAEFSGDKPSYRPVNLSVRKVTVTGKEPSDAVTLAVTPGTEKSDVLKDAPGQGPYVLDAANWYQTFSVAGFEGMGCDLGVSLADKEAVADAIVRFEVYYLSGTTKKGVADLTVKPGTSKNLTFPKNGTYYVRASVSDGVGLECEPFLVHALGYMTETGDCGALTVSAKGTDDATWSLLKKNASGKLVADGAAYPNGATLVLPVGEYAVRYATVKGFSAPADHSVKVLSGKTVVLDGDYYSDTSDHKDDSATGATAWSLKATATGYDRTLWPDDPADYFTFDGKDGCYYSFALSGDAGDAVFSIVNDTAYGGNGGVFAKGVTEVSRLALPKLKTKYRLVVEHGTAAKTGGAYTLTGFMKNVGTIKFAKTAVTAKDTATSVSLTLNRTAKEGAVRVRYATQDGTARAGEHYVAQEGVLEWADGDSKAKTITVKLIPKLIAGAYNGGDKGFSVALADAGGEYPAILSADTATVTVQESVKDTAKTVQSVYAKKAAKLATVKTEVGALRGGTFYGVAQAAADSLPNGLSELAAVTLTVSAKGGVDDLSKDSLSAKVALAGKTYAFKTASKEAAWNETDPQANPKTKTLELVTKVNKVDYTSTLELTVADGDTEDPTAWVKALAAAKLTMYVPDATGKAAQAVVYSGDLYRQNAKIQAYLDAVANFAGYYTVALANANADEKAAPAGHGYLTLTVDNKGTAKVAGLLADGTKLSFSVTAAAVQEDGKGGRVLRVPLHAVKSPYCFGGEILLREKEIDGTNPDGRAFDVVVGLPEGGELVWNNDNAKLTYAGTEGWSLGIQPVGGWYDTVFNLQNYYKDYALTVSTADISEFPKEALADGYQFVTGDDAEQQPDGLAVDLQGDSLVVDKKKLVKDGKLTDLVNSTNPYNVQLKLARATGVVTGSFSLWSDNGTQQKEITGLKHNGIVLLQRDESGILSEANLTAGFFNQSVKLKDGKTTRTWTVSKPFNIQKDKVK